MLNYFDWFWEYFRALMKMIMLVEVDRDYILLGAEEIEAQPAIIADFFIVPHDSRLCMGTSIKND